MRIELDRLEATGGQFAHAYEPEELLLDDEHVRLTAWPQISGKASRSGHQVRLRGRITARAEVDCDRCLKAVDVPVETSFDVTYVPAADYGAEPEAAELQEEDLSLSVFDGETIDVDDLVREQVLLALPTRALCGEDCKGLCPVCGADRNQDGCNCASTEVDPRWAALKNLVNSE
jgi:uncharacterized protein